MALHLLSADMFHPHIGSDFSLLHHGELVVKTRLSRCLEHPKGTMPGTARTAFSLFLEAPVSEMPPGDDGLLTIGHETLGQFGPVNVGRVLSARPGMAMLEIIFN